MYNSNQKIPQRTNDMIALSCLVLFFLFSFCYIFFLKGDLLAEAQFAFSNGVTHYSHFFGAVMITILLLLIQMLVLRMTGLNGRLYALTFLPSFLFLIVTTSVNKAVFEDFTFGSWGWVIPLVLVLYVILVIVIKQMAYHFNSYDDDNHASKYMWPNLITMLIMMLVCGSFHNTSDVEMYELKVEEELLDSNYEDAANIGKESLATSPRLNQLRCFALASMGKLGDSMLDYPQPYKGDGLIDLTDTFSYERINSRNVCGTIGSYSGKSIKTVDRYLDLMLEADEKRENPMVRDYYLCNKLLNNELQDFLTVIHQYYALKDSFPVIELPKLYKEALVIEASTISEDSLNNFCDSVTLQTYRDYKTMCKDYEDDTERYNYTRRKFGNTFFWYRNNYDFLSTTAERAGI